MDLCEPYLQDEKLRKKWETNSSKYLNKTCNEIIFSPPILFLCLFFVFSPVVHVVYVCACIVLILTCLRTTHASHNSMNECMNEVYKKTEKMKKNVFLVSHFFYIVCPAFRHCCHFVVVNVFFPSRCWKYICLVICYFFTGNFISSIHGINTALFTSYFLNWDFS